MFDPHKPVISTRRDAEIAGRSVGLDGPALELWLKAGAPVRAGARASGAADAALAWGRFCSPNDETTALARAVMACCLDENGLGGPLGAGGPMSGTIRHPAFRACGRGRKQAMDGSAWTAAIATAGGVLSAQLEQSHGIRAANSVGFSDSGRVAIRRWDGGTVVDWLEFDPHPDEDPWVVAVARAAIVQGANSGSHHLTSWLGGETDLKGAAQVVNRAAALAVPQNPNEVANSNPDWGTNW